MKLTKQVLKRIIKEELDAIMNEEELDEGMRDLFMGGALALGGLYGANKAVDTFSGNQDRIEQVDDFEGPRDTRNKVQKNFDDLQIQKAQAEEALQRGDYEAAKMEMFDYAQQRYPNKSPDQLEKFASDAVFQMVQKSPELQKMYGGE